MTPGSPKSMVVYPKALASIAASVGGLALFLLFASLILVSPLGSTVSEYFYSADRTSKVGTLSFVNDTSVSGVGLDDARISNSTPGGGDKDKVVTAQLDGTESVVERKQEVQQPDAKSAQEQKVADSSQVVSSNPSSQTNEVHQNGQSQENKDNGVGTESNQIVESGCNLYEGTWVHDPAGPLYTNNSCPVLTQMQNCQGNGRPDKDYENWRWKPTECELPRFDPKKFLELMRGKTLAFVGDSVARNQMESLLCILWQAEVPKNRGNRKMQRYYFRSTNTMIVRIWSSWLVHRISEKFDFAPEGVDKLHLDAPDETFMEFIPTFDVLVLSSGHWFAKQSVYILNNEIVGGQLWWPDQSKQKKIDSTQAFEISVETIISSIVTHPNYTGLTVVRSYSPDHYEGGAWNTGGSCTGKTKPAVDSELAENVFTNTMHGRQVSGYSRGIKKKSNKSRVKLMDITKAFSYRHDGHPGPYRSPDPNKITKRGPDGRPPPQDCLHWCMPGPVDTWNEMLLEVIRRDFEGRLS